MVSRLAAQQVRSQHDLARLMVGREVILSVDKPPVAAGAPVLSARGLSGPSGRERPAFQDIDFDVRRGEIFTITGVAGNGQEDLVAALAGLAPLAGGTLTFHGRTYSAAQWRRRTDETLAYIPEDRDNTGSIDAFSLVENFILTRLGAFGGPLFLDRRRAARATEDAVARYAIQSSGIQGPAGHLSGGNRQKLILARVLSRKPRLIIADLPTQGLDIGATEFVRNKLIEAKKQKAGVLLISEDLDEILAISDWVAPVYEGRIMGIIPIEEARRERIGAMMAGIDHTEELP
jgi:simple sugar transport system ATP-binding protein